MTECPVCGSKRVTFSVEYTTGGIAQVLKCLNCGHMVFLGYLPYESDDYEWW